ncbi:MAG: hypothetical protein U1F43_30360 [Myxococcota bacterium]
MPSDIRSSAPRGENTGRSLFIDARTASISARTKALPRAIQRSASPASPDTAPPDAAPPCSTSTGPAAAAASHAGQ